jgi:hypothetical protein
MTSRARADDSLSGLSERVEALGLSMNVIRLAILGSDSLLMQFEGCLAL